MATFITLINWTEEGIKNFGDSGKRSQAFTQSVEGMGGKVVGLWWTVGPYDLVSVIDAPDVETATALLLKTGSLGFIRTTTLRGFSWEEFEPIIAKAQ